MFGNQFGNICEYYKKIKNKNDLKLIIMLIEKKNCNFVKDILFTISNDYLLIDLIGSFNFYVSLSKFHVNSF